MWTQTLILACGVACAAGAAPLAGSTGATLTPTIQMLDNEKAEGTITAIDLSKKSFTIDTRGGKIDVMTSDSTVYTLDGKESTMAAALKSGRKAKVEHKDRSAIRVDVTTVAAG
jgi:hypothetical protein